MKVLDLRAGACLPHLVRHWTPKPVIIYSIRLSPTGGNFFFAVVGSFECKIAISANFVQTVKNSDIFTARKAATKVDLILHHTKYFPTQ